jgi:chromosome segregation ATPase
MKQQPQQQGPDPEAQKAQAQQQADQAKMQAQTQIEQGKAQLQQQIEQSKLQATAQIEQAKMQHQMQLESQKQSHEAQMQAQETAQKESFDRWKAELDAATKIMVAQIGKSDITPSVDMAEQAASDSMVVALGNNLHEAMSSMANTHAQTMQRIGDVMSAMQSPKRIVRGSDGRAMGVETVQQTPVEGLQ